LTTDTYLTGTREYLEKAMHMRYSIIGAVLLALTTVSARADSVLNVTVDTAVVAGTDVKFVFDMTANTPFLNTLYIENFSAPGSVMGLPETTGGLIDGDLILGLNPAPFTYIETATFFNELIVNLTPVLNSVTFTLDYTTNAPGLGVLPDEIDFYLLDGSYNPLFPTSDPLGADSLLAIDLNGASTSPGNIEITVPGSAPATVPEPNSIWLTLTVVVVGIVARKFTY
jgi:hypothetical protein